MADEKIDSVVIAQVPGGGKPYPADTYTQRQETQLESGGGRQIENMKMAGNITVAVFLELCHTQLYFDLQICMSYKVI